MRGAFISGSDTGVGKTTFACSLARALAKQTKIAVRKPVESGCPAIGGALFPHDADLLQKSSQSSDALEVICPYRFEAPLSPERAARLVGKRLKLESLVRSCQNIPRDAFLLVEGAGGVYSPIAEGALNVELARALLLPLVLIVEDRIGAIHQALVNLKALKADGVQTTLLALNQKIPNTLYNAEEIARYTGVKTICFTPDKEDSSLDAAAYLLGKF